MVGVIGYGAYIPFHRLTRSEISRAWGGPAVTGEKAVASYDEDSVSMAVAACRDCIKGHDRSKVDALYLGSTTFPYLEKQSASIVATALDLNPEMFTLDLSNSLRSGTGAMRLAVDAVKAKTVRNALVSTADVRSGLPNGPKELDFGDGAAALLVGEENIIATIDAIYSAKYEIHDFWRPAGETFVRSWEDRFTREKGYAKVMTDSVSNALKRYQFTPRDFSKAVLYSPNPTMLSNVARSLGFDTRTQIQSSLYDTVGNTGCAQAMMMLVAALEEAKPGDRLLWASYGDGCDVYILTVTDKIKEMGNRRGIKKHLASKKVISNYERYLRWRNIVPIEPAARDPLQVPSAVALWRDNRGGLALYGVKCQKCGAPQYPAQRVCMNCQARDAFEEYGFADREGKVATFSQDNLAVSVDPPVTITTVDFAGGGRIICDMTDRDPQKVAVGMPVEMTFREVRFVGGIHDYWWKCQPVRA